MAQPGNTNIYVQGHSASTTSTQQTRTAESDAAWLLPYIKKTDHILDVGCGPGTITTGLARYASEGSTVGIDISKDVLERAKALNSSTNVRFEEGNILECLDYPDESFDIVFASQVFGHLRPSPELPLRALAEIRRVLKPGGILATRDAAESHFFPQGLDLDRLWRGNLSRAIRHGADDDGQAPGANMTSLFRKAGFDVDSGKVLLGAGSTVYSGLETRRWLAKRATSQLHKGTGDPFRQNWLDAGITEEEIEETLRAVEAWTETEDAWYGALQCEMLAWK